MNRLRYRESGFALIAAMLAIWMLTAMGVLIFTVTSQDVRISSRMVGERKAFYGSEAGVQALTQTFTPTNLNDASLYNVPFTVDAGTDPNTTYVISNPTIPTSGPPSIPISGFAIDSGHSFVRVRYVANVTGSNSRYNSSVPITVGAGYGPVDNSTIYP